MAISTVINVVIGLILMYLLLGLICTVINEFIASFTMLGARNLGSGINKIVDDRNFQAALRSTGVLRWREAPRGRKAPLIFQLRHLQWHSSTLSIRKGNLQLIERRVT